MIIFLGLKTVAHILDGDSNRSLALNSYIVFYSLIKSLSSSDKGATLDRICFNILAKLRQLEDINLERFVIYYIDGTKTDEGISLPRSYYQCRLANSSVTYEKSKYYLVIRMAANSWQAHQGFHEIDGRLEETLRRDAAQI